MRGSGAQQGRRRLLVGAALGIALADALLLGVLQRHGLAVRLLPVAEMAGEDDPAYRPRESAENQERFLRQLREEGFAPGGPASLPQVVALSSWVGDSVSRVGSYWGKERGFGLLQAGLAGTPLACGSMSEIFREALVLLGHRARSVQLYAGDFARDTHVTVEVWLEGRWVVFDPTFHVTFEAAGRPLGVAEVQRLLREKRGAEIEPRHHGPRAYPAVLAEYPVEWRQLFANAYVYSSSSSRLFLVPPLRWWLGPKWYVFGDADLLLARGHAGVYLVACQLLPGALLVLFPLAVGWRWGRRSAAGKRRLSGAAR